MTQLAIEHHVVPQQLFGALPGRSAVDLVSCVVHDAEAARRCNRITALVTLDVQGAFDGVLHNHLLMQMRGQGWPLALCRWIESFLRQRRVKIRYKDGVTEDKVMDCDVTQGSLLSPLLSPLYISILIQKGSPNSRFGYADDIAIIRIGKDPGEAIAAAQHEVDRLAELAAEHKIDFDPAKSELLVIGGGLRKKIC
ncbi:hypothetical protein K3495_g12440 [Podosphaera aphanis]|nr:hypothetical protein K3495_g12440 [Podosphaera aphanis]